MVDAALIFAAIMVIAAIGFGWRMHYETVSHLKDPLRYEREDKVALLDRLQARDVNEFVGLTGLRSRGNGFVPESTSNPHLVREVHEMLGG